MADNSVNIRTLKFKAEIDYGKFDKDTDKIEKKINALGDVSSERKNPFSVLGEAAKKSSKGIRQFASSIGRIAKYRIIRTVLKGITSALKEGITNLYQYSSAMDGAFAKNINEVGASTLYLKNSFGAALAPIIESLTPIIVNAANGLAEFNNNIAQMAAVLKGQDTYIKAAKIDVDKYAESLKKAKSATLGFDELNIISGSNYDYSDMFEEAATSAALLQETASNLVLSIKDVVFDWGSEATAEDVVQKIITAIPMVAGAAIGLHFGGARGAVVGIALGAALGLMISSLAFDHDGKLSGTEILNLISIALSTIGGGIIGFMLGGPLGAAFGAIIGMGVTLIIMSVTNKLTEKARGEAINNLLSQISDLYQSSLNIELGIDKLTGSLSDEDIGRFKLAYTYLDRIFSLEGIDIKTPSQMAELNSLVKAFNGLRLDGIQLEFDETTGKIKQTKDEITRMIGELERSYKVKAMESAYIEAYKLSRTAQSNYEDALSKQADLNALAGLARIQYNSQSTLEKIFDWTPYINWKTAQEAALEGAAKVDDMKRIADKAAERANELLNELTSQYVSSGNDLKTRTSPHLYKGINIDEYASGGFPTTGELFMARENGAELVGSIGSRAAVANNDQIVEAVSAGVYEAVSAAMEGRKDNQAIYVYLDGKQINAAIKKVQREAGAVITNSTLID